MPISVEKCRELLGTAASGKSDEQIGRLLDGLIAVANEAYDSLTQAIAIYSETLAVASERRSRFPCHV